MSHHPGLKSGEYAERFAHEDKHLNEYEHEHEHEQKHKKINFIPKFETSFGLWPNLLIATIGINVLSLSLPVMTLQVYDRILPNPGTGTLPVLIAGVCLAIFLEIVLRLARAYMIGRTGASYEHHLSCKAMENTLNADLSKMQYHGIGEHLHRIGCIGKTKDFHNGYSFTVWVEMAFVPVFFALIIYISGVLAFIPATILALFIAVSILNGSRLKKALEEREQADDTRFNFLIESLKGIHTLKAFALEKFFERRYEALEKNSTYTNYTVTQEIAHTSNSAAIFSNLMVAAVITCGALLVLSGGLSTGD
jgi:ATP-binding cassette subfamily C protein LapB